MTYDEKLASRVREALAESANVRETKMFGGVAFLVNGKMCVTVGRTGIMCRIDPAIQSTLIRSKGCRPVIMGGRKYRGYVRVEVKALRTEDDLNVWVRYALDFNERIKAGLKTSR